MDIKASFSGFSVNNLTEAKQFYTETLGLDLKSEDMGITLRLPGGGEHFMYEKPDHSPASFTVLNFVVNDIDAAVNALAAKGIAFEQYELGFAQQDDKGILRGKAANMGPDIAWFKDPAGNILAVLQN